MRRSIKFTIGVIIGCLLQVGAFAAHAEGGGSSNFVPDLTLSYVDPDSGERFECGADCRRFTVPAGTRLEVRVRVQSEGGNSAGDEVTWDLWFNQPNHPFPGLDLAPCYDPLTGQSDRACWQAMQDRVDRVGWDALKPDLVCVPGFEGGSCRDNLVGVVVDADFDGARRPGVYHFALWINRFSVVPESDEFDNFAGPIRVTVEPRPDGQDFERFSTLEPGHEVGDVVHPEQAENVTSSTIVVPSSPMPYGVVTIPEEVDTGFTVTSMRSQRLLEFSPAYAGRVSVEVVQTGTYENMVVQVRKVSTGEVKIEAGGKGRLRLHGGLDNFDLRDDRTFEVVVIPGQGSRGIRGSIRVSYPARLRYMLER
ncbi:MAG: hypothetical protein QNL88_07520 [Acidobacteriota bacterium]|nr:hypothetical protein [Acidobacteriota bacterium]